MTSQKRDMRERFEEKFKVMESGCHEWQSNFHRDGYGKFWNEGFTRQSHRIAYRLYVGEIPEGRWVLHKCDNRKCVNPEHLFLGDSKANIADMDSKKRRGTKSKLTYSQVAEIKELLAQRFSQEEVARKFGIDQTTVSRIKLNKTTLFKQD